MHIQQIEISNFRSIENISIDCREGINLFIGNNGAGKSTILDALKILLSWFIARLRNAKGQGLYPNDLDIRNGSNYCLLAMTLTNGTRWQVFKQRSHLRTNLPYKSDFSQLNTLTNTLAVQLGKEQDMALPMIAYYGVNRAVTDIPLRLNKKHKLSQIDSYDTALNDGADYRSFFEWFREREDIENEELSKTSFPITFPLKFYDHDSQLQAVRTAWQAILPEYNGFRVRRNPRAFMLTKNAGEMDFRQLSDGERCFLTMTGNIARKLAMTHPASTHPNKEYGIVIIDELDLHLHPQWQTIALPRMRKVFPNCQFFVCTHSPFVVSNININANDSLWVMQDGEINRVANNVYGADCSLLLQAYFNIETLRNPDVQQHIDAIWLLLKQGDNKSDDYHAHLMWLKQHLSDSDSEFVRIALQSQYLDQK